MHYATFEACRRRLAARGQNEKDIHPIPGGFHRELSVSHRRTDRAPPGPDALWAASETRAARPAAQIAECLSLLAGLYLAISPWVVGFHATAPALSVTDLATGLTLVVLALGYAPAFERTHGMAMTAVLAGVWAIVAPWVVYASPTTTRIETSNIVVGAVAAFFALMTLAQGMPRTRAERAARR